MNIYYCPYFNLYLLLERMLKILGYFSGIHGQVSDFYMKSNGNIIFDLRIFTLQTVFTEQITFVNWGTPVYETVKGKR
jgi:hypothetical protein